MSSERFSQLELEQELREALNQGDFTAFFQPIVDLASGEIVGVEALARWRHRRLGLLDPSAFLIVAERALVRQIERAAVSIQALRDKGVKVAIDDFGMGYSSLSYLRQFPVDVLKIDQTFIQEIQTDSDARAGVSLADAIIAMAKGLGLSVIAEGVERRAQLAYLSQQGCDQAQGYLFGEPCDEKEMLSVLAQGDFRDILDATAPQMRRR